MLAKFAESLGVDHTTVSKRLKLLGMIQKQGHWMPIVTGNEKWIHYDNSKRSRLWGKPGHVSTSSAKPNKSCWKHEMCQPLANVKLNMLRHPIQDVVPSDYHLFRSMQHGSEQENYTHCTVNHAENFVDPHTGVHTQNIERLWRDMKSVLPRYGTSKAHYEHYLHEFMLKRYYSLQERIDVFFDIMTCFYSAYRDQ
ncbi:hypothetical protein ALC62_11050 [Cyphomyrmex costatus]|uniref:ISXO2-like transposase domain-containing protein n=1 Tax=Cyphomyrmex costatus TaxID=456900 RepID=A0A151ICY6_9HYME|nr:hypothetical protein ALC62_11050 [Cyphomyrmex costatus]